jgi:DNA-binding GntR family transcriptional regulator
MEANLATAPRRGPEPVDARNDRVTQTYQRLRELIIWGQLAPGTRIGETDVAARLGVSRTPVRAALQRLQQEGYIVAPANGIQSRLSVAPLTQADARELFGIVAELEALAARAAAARPAQERRRTVARLRGINAELAETATTHRRDQYRLFDLDQAFHRTYVDAGAGIRLRLLHLAVKPQTERYVRMYIGALVDDIDHSLVEHEAVIDALHEGDPERAKAAVMNNWTQSADRLAIVIARLGERGAW